MNSNKKTIININRVITSVNADSKIVILNNSFFCKRFLVILSIKAANILLISTLASANSMKNTRTVRFQI